MSGLYIFFYVLFIDFGEDVKKLKGRQKLRIKTDYGRVTGNKHFFKAY